MALAIDMYARMLEAQANFQFPFERPFYSDSRWREAFVVVDFGCGDGTYLDLLAREFPEKRYFAIDSNEQMREIAQRKCRHDNISFHSSLDEIDASAVDFFLMRYVVLHLENRELVFQSIRECASTDASILIIEPDDRKIKIDPPFSLLEEAIARMQAASRHRNLREQLDDELQAIGFSLIDYANPTILIDAETVDHRILRYAYSIIELGFQSRISESQKALLLDWSLEKSHLVQLGFDGRFYLRHCSRNEPGGKSGSLRPPPRRRIENVKV
jgi:trans-aconitate methyltransferase